MTNTRAKTKMATIKRTTKNAATPKRSPIIHREIVSPRTSIQSPTEMDSQSCQPTADQEQLHDVQPDTDTMLHTKILQEMVLTMKTYQQQFVEQIVLIEALREGITDQFTQLRSELVKTISETKQKKCNCTTVQTCADSTNKIVEQITNLETRIYEKFDSLKQHSTPEDTDIEQRNLATSGENATIKQMFNELQNTMKRQQVHKDAETRAKKLKISISADWNEAMTARKKGYWNSIKSRNKARLYEQWTVNHPNFIPKKFRPKIVKNEDPQRTDGRIREARERYKSDTANLKTYEKIHYDKYTKVDSEMMKKMEELSTLPEVTENLKSMWWNQVAENENKSLEIWNRKERFLNSMKHKELISGDFIFNKIKN